MEGVALPITDPEFVSNLIPQKSPFVMVDRLLAYSPTEVTAGLTIEASNILVENRRLSEAGLIEHMAQATALHTGYQYFMKQEKAPTGYLGAINKVAIEELPQVGETLVTSATILHEIMGVTLVSITVKRSDKILATATLKTVLAH